MNELDLYDSYRLPTTVSSKNKKRTKKHNGKWFIIFIIIIFMAIIFFVANAFANFLSFSNTSVFGSKNNSAKGYNAYAIVVDKFQDKTQANALSLQLQNAGASGYIIYDLEYQVLASAYLKSEDAQNVLEKVLGTYNNAEISIIKVNSIQLKKLEDKKDNEIITKALNLFKNTYESLYDLGINLDTSNITSAQAKFSITQLLNEISGISSEFRDIINKTNDTTYKLTQAKIDQLEENINELVESSLISTKLSSLIKYSQINCLILQNELAKLLN